MKEENKTGPDESGSAYLWDATGAADPEVERLENLLGPFKYDDRPAVFLSALPTQESSEAPYQARRAWLSAFAFATVVALLFVAGAIMRKEALRASEQRTSGWDVTEIEGAPRIGRETLRAGQQQAKLGVGQTLETNADSQASLSATDLGEIKIEPNSRVRLLQSEDNRKRIQMQVGTIHAMIWAPPGQFVVDTPSATAIDLGCAYTLKVAPDGSGTIRTTLGWVGFRLNGRDSFIPAGAMCSTRPGIGPGTPYFEDASAPFQRALAILDFGAATDLNARADALRTVLVEARPRDALTLWHLLFRARGGDRERVYTRLATLAPPPAGVTREGALTLKNEMLDAWWNTFGLGDISLWRDFEQEGAPR